MKTINVQRKKFRINASECERCYDARLKNPPIGGQHVHRTNASDDDDERSKLTERKTNGRSHVEERFCVCFRSTT